MKKVLIVTYYWPPAGGPGVQRVLKFAKYLPEFGWEPLILTVCKGEYPAYDESLLEEVPGDLKVFRTESFEPFTLYKRFTGSKSEDAVPVAVLSQKGLPLKKRIAHFIRLNLIIPDAKKGWKRYALKAARNIISEERPDLIFSSSPPPTVHLIARKLAERYKIKWVADLRDRWSKIHYYKKQRLALPGRIDAALEKRTLSRADRIITVSQHFAGLINSEKKQIDVIPNGFDRDDFKCPDKELFQNNVLQISYIGGLNQNRYYPEFFTALKDFTVKAKLKSDRIQLNIAGMIQPEFRDSIIGLMEEKVKINFTGYLSHGKALELMSVSDVLLLFLEQVADYEGHVPGKLFEYLNSGRYVLGLGPKNGNAAGIINRTKGGTMLAKEDNIEASLRGIYSKWEKGALRGADPADLSKFSRKELTKDLTRIFGDVICE